MPLEEGDRLTRPLLGVPVVCGKFSIESGSFPMPGGPGRVSRDSSGLIPFNGTAMRIERGQIWGTEIRGLGACVQSHLILSCPEGESRGGCSL